MFSKSQSFFKTFTTSALHRNPPKNCQKVVQKIRFEPYHGKKPYSVYFLIIEYPLNEIKRTVQVCGLLKKLVWIFYLLFLFILRIIAQTVLCVFDLSKYHKQIKIVIKVGTAVFKKNSPPA